MPRSIMADIIYKNEDDLVKRRHRTSALVELPSGAWQKRLPPGASTAADPHPPQPVFSPPQVVATTALSASGMSGLRQRRARAEGGGAAEKAPQPEVMVIYSLKLVLLLLADFMLERLRKVFM